MEGRRFFSSPEGASTQLGGKPSKLCLLESETLNNSSLDVLGSVAETVPEALRVKVLRLSLKLRSRCVEQSTLQGSLEVGVTCWLSFPTLASRLWHVSPLQDPRTDLVSLAMDFGRLCELGFFCRALWLLQRDLGLI